MSAFTPPTTFADDTTISAASLNECFSDASVAINAIDSDNFDNDSVPLLALAAKEALIPVVLTFAPDMTLEGPGVLGNAAETEAVEYIGHLAGGDYTAVAISAVANHLSVTTDPILQLRYLTYDDDTYQDFGPQMVLRAEGVYHDVTNLALPLTQPKDLYCSYTVPPAGEEYGDITLTLWVRSRLLEV